MPAPLPLSAINHVARETPDVDRCISFYRDVLGFKMIRRPDFSFRGAWLYGYGVQIHVIEGAPYPKGAAISPRADHIAFHTEDIQGVENALREHGISYLRNVQAQTGVIQLFFHDPEGNHIEVACYPQPVQGQLIE